MATFAFGGANSNQLRAIGATEGLLLITAGPGTGNREDVHTRQARNLLDS